MNRSNNARFKVKSFSSLFVLLLFFALSCEQKEDNIGPDPIASSALDEHFQFLSESTGVDKSKIVYDKAHDRFFIDSDLCISKKAVEEYLEDKNSKPSSNKRTEQRRYTYLVNTNTVNNIKYFVRPSVPGVWRTAISQAIAEWNNVGGCKVRMYEVSNTNEANVNVDMFFEESSTVAYAYLPFSNGAVGNGLNINSKYNGMEPGVKLFTIVHEMGHNIGFLHTNQTDGSIIPGTPEVDANSVMNSFVLPWNGFTNFDKIAARNLYPGTSNMLGAGNQLNQGQSIRSLDGRFVLIMQTDGNLVIYKNGAPIWATGTFGNPAITKAVMQTDGNFVLYDNSNRPYWSSRTNGYPNGYLVMQNDGNLVIYQGGSARWASGTCCQ